MAEMAQCQQGAAYGQIVSIVKKHGEPDAGATHVALYSHVWSTHSKLIKMKKEEIVLE